MKIRVLGTGCARCEMLYERTKEAVESLGIEADLEKVETLDEILDYGVMITPAIVVDDEVKIAGKLPSVSEIASMLSGGTAGDEGRSRR